MATTFMKADRATHAEVRAIACEYNADLEKAGVSILVLWADGGLEVRGQPAAASARIAGKRERAAGMPDCCITLDREKWDELDAAAAAPSSTTRPATSGPSGTGTTRRRGSWTTTAGRGSR
jgi:hypothetical protein